MPSKFIRPPACFLTRKRKTDIALRAMHETEFKKWIEKQKDSVKSAITESGFKATPGQVYPLRNDKGQLTEVLCGVSKPIELYDFAKIVKALGNAFSEKMLADASFSLRGKTGLENACIGWALACYRFDIYKESDKPLPRLVLPAGVDKTHIHSMIEGLCLVRDLINTPANDMGPAELEKAAKELAGHHDAEVRVIGEKVLKKDFPLVYAVGMASPRRPRLIDLTWGNAKAPRITIVGKGVCFDTGGLDLKPSQYMALMKKDMGGAAHALGLARLIMGAKLPVRLRVLIPAVENAVAGESFRPGDVFTSRKGLTVENTNTDAEGRLILADALTYACEEKPELVIDFCTLTGSARAALGADIPAMFCNNDKLGAELQKLSMAADDPIWQMPLWKPYKKLIESDIADLVNSAATPGDLIYSSLFLESFLLHDTDWIHLDVFAWEKSGKPGRPKGGADTGLRAVYALLEKRYGK